MVAVGSDAFAELVDGRRDASDDDLTEQLRQLEMDRRRIEAELAASTTEVDRRSLYAVDG